MKKAPPSLSDALSDSFVILPPGTPVDISNIDVKSLGISKERLQRALNPPHEATGEVIQGVFVKTPFKPLEELEAPETLAWVDRQNKQTDNYLAGAAASRDAATATLRKALDYDAPAAPSRYGDNYIRTRTKPLAAQSHLEMAPTADGPWRTIIDPNTIDPRGLVSMTKWNASKDGKRIVYLLSTAGSDKNEIHIFNTETGKDLPEVLGVRTLPAAVDDSATTIIWDKDSHGKDSHDGFTYRDDEGIVKHHTLGEPGKNDRIVYDPADGWACALRFNTAKYEWIYRGYGTERKTGLLYRPFGSDAPFKEVFAPWQFKLRPIAEQPDGSVLALTDKDAPRGRLISFRPEDPAPEKWRTIIPQGEDVLDTIVFRDNKLMAFYTHEAAEACKIYTEDGRFLHDVPLPVQSIVNSVDGSKSGKMTLKISSFRSKGDFYTYDIRKNELVFDRKGPAPHDLNDCIVEHIYATSKDGTKVPMTVVRRPDTVLDGTAAVKMTGYGGYGASRVPHHSADIWQFVRAGGIFVQTNIRGGSEFGQEWYDGGRQLTKQNVFDDFAACAQELIARKYTSAKRLAVEGRSNGGLLMAVSLEQHPELFGAVITGVPVADMFGLEGTSASEYGKPNKVKADFNAAARYSPVHNVKEDAKYPPHLIITADHDDRVDPWHAYKLAAMLQSKSHKDNVTLLRVQKNTGHLGGNTEQEIAEDAEKFAFIEKAIGPVDQQAYKATLAQIKKIAMPPTGGIRMRRSRSL